MKHTIMRNALLFSFLFMLLASVSCGSNKSLEIEKEKIQYKEKVQKTLDRLERKLTTMRAESEESDTTTVENELATDDSLSQFETMEDQLNQKLGEMENVADSDWNNLKAQIDQLLAEYEQKIDESIE